MSLHEDLLRQARHLAGVERTRPRQASLRRAISAAYYAVFHLLVHEGRERLVKPRAMRGRFARAFEHGDMKQASRAFNNPQPSRLAALTGGSAVPREIRRVADAFVTLQEARQDADYNVEARYTRAETIDFVRLAERAFRDWEAVRDDPVATTYLASMLLWKKWKR